MEPNRDPKAKRTGGTPLREACLQKALEAIRDKGVEGLSLRDVARRLNVSHQAPYKHFASKDHLLAEVIRRCLRDFATHLRRSGDADDGTHQPPLDAMRALGSAYLGYAAANPLEYRLMFMTTWPNEARGFGLASDSRAAFDVLGERLQAVRPYDSSAERDRDAMFVWSAIHGIASVLQSEAMHYLSFSPSEAEAAVAHARSMIDRAIARVSDRQEDDQ
ncbi:MAG: TetR/AcrR family transcriptional regulator [Pseudomonadota bacterium]